MLRRGPVGFSASSQTSTGHNPKPWPRTLAFTTNVVLVPCPSRPAAHCPLPGPGGARSPAERPAQLCFGGHRDHVRYRTWSWTSIPLLSPVSSSPQCQGVGTTVIATWDPQGRPQGTQEPSGCSPRGCHWGSGTGSFYLEKNSYLQNRSVTSLGFWGKVGQHEAYNL